MKHPFGGGGRFFRFLLKRNIEQIFLGISFCEKKFMKMWLLIRSKKTKRAKKGRREGGEGAPGPGAGSCVKAAAGYPATAPEQAGPGQATAAGGATH